MRNAFDLSKKKEKTKKLEKISQEKDFWQDPEKAKEIRIELNSLKKEAEKINNFKKEINDLKEIIELSEEKEPLLKELVEKLQILEEKIGIEEKKIFLTAKYDKNSAILTIIAGAGGRDSQDWATLLKRMYERYSQKKGFQVKTLAATYGEGGGPEGRIGIKRVTLEIVGNFAYGFLKKESGVHRLVRISPFSSKSLRHTSFAFVEVLPEMKKSETEKIKIEPEFLKIDFFKASGPGGQNVNKRETAVRIIHLPTEVTVSCQSERTQGRNRQLAMKILISKLLQLKEKEKKEKLSEIKPKSVPIEWGNQIRSYILHPYKLVKDLRTGVETVRVDEVLAGSIDQFIVQGLKND